MEQIDSFAEQNPMLASSWLPLARYHLSSAPTHAQVRAIATAMAQLKKEGFDPKPELMIPLVSVKPELEKLRALAEEVIAEVAAAEGVELASIPIGTMIELPRAARQPLQRDRSSCRFLLISGTNAPHADHVRLLA